MMLSKAGGHDKEDSYNGQLLRDIKEISKALYLHKTPAKALMSPSQVRSKSAGKTRVSDSINRRTPNEIGFHKGKKSSSGWSWKKPLKALAHIGQHRFNICFVLHVHSIEGLPSSFDGSGLVVQWKRNDTVLSSEPSRVFDGIAKFEETLMHRCSVYGNRNGPHKSAKYETEFFLIYALAVEAPGVDLGKHWIDFTKLLPLSLDQLDSEKSMGKWRTSFKLSGVASDAALNVSLGYSIIRDNFGRSHDNLNVASLGYSIIRDNVISSHDNLNAASGSSSNRGLLRQAGSVSSQLDRLSSPTDEANCSHHLSPDLSLELSRSIDSLYQKLNKTNLLSLETRDILPEHNIEKPKPEHFGSAKQADKCDDTEFGFIKKGIETCKQEATKLEENAVQNMNLSKIEVIDVSEILKEEDSSFDDDTKFFDGLFMNEPRNEESSVSSRQSLLGESESAFSSQAISESFDLESSSATDDFLDQENFLEMKSSYKAMKMSKKSVSLDDITESVASEFLNMLELEDSSYACTSYTSPESPRELLLREFEKEAMASGNFFLDYGGKMEYWSELPHHKEQCEEFPFAMASGDCFLDYDGKMEYGSEPSDHEEHHEQFSFSSTIQNPKDKNNNNNNHGRKDQLLIKRRKAKVLEDLETEALMREWGLNENVFRNPPLVHSDGFGSPIELPLEEPPELPALGEGFGPFVRTKSGGYIRSMNPLLFRNLKSSANLIMQVSAPVVLPAELGFDAMEILQSFASLGAQKFSRQFNALIPLEDTTGKTIHQVAEESVACNMMFERLDLNSSDENKTVLEHGSLHQPDSFHSNNEFEGIRSCIFSGYVSLKALTPLAMDRIESLLVEGLRIQCGMSDQDAPSCISPKPIDNLDNVSELIGFSLTLDEWLRLDAGIISDEDRINEHSLKFLLAHCFDKDKPSGGKNGFLADKLTVAFMVLLRDPIRNYEPVGVSMLALIQVERESFSSNPDTHSKVLEDSKSETPLWRMTQVHLAGLKTEHAGDCSWGTRTQQQAGTRWLLACGIIKSRKVPSLKSTGIIAQSNPQAARNTNDFLWSLICDNHGGDTDGKKIGALVPITRNPNVIFPK